MVKDYEIREALDKAANSIRGYNRNPSTWSSWIIYLLANLDKKSMDVDPANQRRYEEMLSNLQDNIYNRRQTGGW